MKETMFDIIEWHKKTFPTTTEEELSDKADIIIDKGEIYDSLDEVIELYIIGCGLMRFNHWKGLEIMYMVLNLIGIQEASNDWWVLLQEKVEKKMKENRNNIDF